MRAIKIISFLVILNPVFSQTFEDRFINNDNNWILLDYFFEGEESDAMAEFNSGLSVIQNSGIVAAFVLKDFGAMYDTITEIECSISHLTGTEVGVGLIWDYESIAKHKRLVITVRDQQFFVQSETSDEKNILVEWTENTAINMESESNVLKLKSVNDNLEYYINDTLVYTEISAFISPKNIGFLLGPIPGATSKVEYIIVKGKLKN